MILFWTITAVMILTALLLLAPALLRRRGSESRDRDQQNVVIARERLAELCDERDQGALDQAQFEQAKSELESSLLQDLDHRGIDVIGNSNKKSGWLALGVVALFVPLLTLGLYAYLGSPQLVLPPNPALTEGHSSEGKMPPVEEMVDRLVERLKQNPDDAEGWYLLGRTNMALKDYATAATAFEKVHELVGDEPAVLLAWADALAMRDQGNMLGHTAELIRKAVGLSPDDSTALWLAGMVEEQTGNYAQAISYWERLAPQIADDPQARERVAALISRAREKSRSSAEPAAMVGAAAAVQEAAAVVGKSVSVRVSLAPELSGKVGPEEAVFIYARAMQGPKMPLAAERRQVKELPLTLTLDDAGAMVPAMKISNFDQVVVGARVSRSGGAIAQSGDLTGEVTAVTVGTDTLVEVLIDKVVP